MWLRHADGRQLLLPIERDCRMRLTLSGTNACDRWIQPRNRIKCTNLFSDHLDHPAVPARTIGFP